MEDSAVMNNIITDIKEGFVQRRLPDGGFKVKIFKRVYLRGWKNGRYINLLIKFYCKF